MILALESSCDESALALFDAQKGFQGEWIHSQIAQHAPYGGIVPEIASRAHLQQFPALLEELKASLNGDRPETIAVTVGPGLAGCLALGIGLAESLAVAWKAPLIGVNHLRAHAWSVFIPLFESESAQFKKNLKAQLPHLGLLVSGGNTLLFRIHTDYSIEILAQTLDDAAGEALDKGAKLLGMEYPGGPLIEAKAEGGNPAAYDFPRAFAETRELKFSFSGLKTSLRYQLEHTSDAELKAQMSDICASYQQAVVDALLKKVEQAWSQHGPFASLGLSGGVAHNKVLRAAFAQLGAAQNCPVHMAHPRHSGDNAGMVAFNAWVDPAGCMSTGPLKLQPSLRLA